MKANMVFGVVAGLLLFVNVQAKTCQEYTSCEALIKDYPSGEFGTKDRNKDGVPCENVCSSVEEVKDLLDKVKSPGVTNINQ